MKSSSTPYSFPLDPSREGGRSEAAQLLGLVACALAGALQGCAGCYVFSSLLGAELSLAVYTVVAASAAVISGVVVAALMQSSER